MIKQVTHQTSVFTLARSGSRSRSRARQASNYSPVEFSMLAALLRQTLLTTTGAPAQFPTLFACCTNEKHGQFPRVCKPQAIMISSLQGAGGILVVLAQIVKLVKHNAVSVTENYMYASAAVSGGHGGRRTDHQLSDLQTAHKRYKQQLFLLI